MYLLAGIGSSLLLSTALLWAAITIIKNRRRRNAAIRRAHQRALRRAIRKELGKEVR